MVRDVICVASDLPIEKLEDLLLERGIGGVPVTDADGRPIGMVSKTDLVELRRKDPEHRKKCVGDIMMHMAFCLGANETVAKAAGLMAFEGMHRVVVVGEDGRVIGLVSTLDVLRWLARESGYTISNRR